MSASVSTTLSTDGQTLAQAAIEKALAQDWQEAAVINSTIIKTDPTNIDALNRLAFACFQLGDTPRAKRYYQKVLKLDAYNPIALKNLKKLVGTKHKNMGRVGIMSPLMFLEEPGKTKIIALVNLAPQRLLATLSAGEEVFLKIKRHCVEIRNHNDMYLGALPDDLSFKLIKLLNGGNTYNTVVKSIGKNQLMVFLREISRGRRFEKQPSFVSSIGYPPLVKPEGSEPLGEGGEESADSEDVPSDAGN